MKLVLVCTAVVLLSSAGQLTRLARRRGKSVNQMYREANITQPYVPQEKVDLHYGDYVVTLGMDIDPGKTIGLPVLVGLDFDSDCYYTVILNAIDSPIPNNSFLSPFLLGMYTNVQGNSNGCMLEQSCEMATWLNPCPRPGSGRQRYVLIILKQNRKIDTNNNDLRKYQRARQNFGLSDFAEAYGLILPPVGGCYFSSEYQQYSREDRSEN